MGSLISAGDAGTVVSHLNLDTKPFDLLCVSVSILLACEH